MASVRKKALEEYAKSVEGGNPLAEDFVGKSENPLRDALRARNLAEESLAQKVLDNTGIPIPDKTSSWSRKEDFLNQILKERYPELKPNVSFKEMDGNVGEYVGGKIFLNKNLANTRDIQKLTSDVFHEGAHNYDDIKKIIPEISQDDFNKEMRKLKSSGFDLKNADPAQVYEMIAKKHHAQIPDLREGTFGLGALKSYLKSGTFKALPIIGTAAAGAAALSSPDASAAAADLAIPGGLESLGPSEEDAAIENPQASPELRRKALESLLRK
jgi:hypothetical protein